ncbi:MAG TPA: hypothetical protein VKP64_12600 [Mycobacteriales bacterium]|nr:hypothetical protein [Mycobacteriales bacterium]
MLRHLFAPLTTTYSTVLPFRAGEHTVVLGAHPDRPVRTYRTLAAAEGLVFRLLAAEPLGSWQEWGRLAVGARLPAEASRELRFDPWRHGGGLVPVGWLQRLRLGAYRASQAARD